MDWGFIFERTFSAMIGSPYEPMFPEVIEREETA